jgi:hypothetical protein
MMSLDLISIVLLAVEFIINELNELDKSFVRMFSNRDYQYNRQAFYNL